MFRGRGSVRGVRLGRRDDGSWRPVPVVVVEREEVAEKRQRAEEGQSERWGEQLSERSRRVRGRAGVGVVGFLAHPPQYDRRGGRGQAVRGNGAGSRTPATGLTVA